VGSSWAGADSGILTILTVYSLMNGATLHVMPHLFQQAGLLVGEWLGGPDAHDSKAPDCTACHGAGVVVTGVIGAISCYTCGLIVQIGAYSTEEQDFSDWYRPADIVTFCMDLETDFPRSVAVVLLYFSRMQASGYGWGKQV
jgi:hypothetical protein